MKKPLLVLALSFSLVFAPFAAAIEVRFTSAPESVNHGASYYVEVTAWSGSSWGWSDVALFKNGTYVAWNGGSSYFSAGTWQSDPGPQAIEYLGYGQNYDTGEVSADWRSVVINPPANQAPFGVCDYTPGQVGRGASLSGNGWAADHEMGAAVARVEVVVNGSTVCDASLGGDRLDVANFYGREDFRFSGWSFSWSTAGLAPGTHTLFFRAWDNQGGSSEFGHRTFNVINAVPSITLLSPSAQTVGLGATLTLSSRATDADGNITTHNLDIQRPDGTWNWQGGFAAGEPFMGGPVGSGADSTRSASFTFDRVGTWYVRSWVSDATGNNLHSATVPIEVVDNQAPSVPSGLTASLVTANTFTLSWTAATDNVGVVAYEVMRGATSLGTTGATSLAITGLNPTTGYAMRVRAVDAAGNWSAWSAVLSVTTPMQITAPGNPVAASVGSSFATLSWNPGTVSSGAVRYLVYRDGTPLTLTPISATNFSDWGLLPGNTYKYSIRTVNSAGQESAAVEITVITPTASLEVFSPLAL